MKEMGTTGEAAGSPEETLRNGSKPTGNGGLKAPGNSQGSDREHHHRMAGRVWKHSVKVRSRSRKL